MEKLPFISVIIPCRNEEKHIANCLDSIIANKYPTDRMEVLVVDGMSTDATKRILNDYSKKYGFIKVLDNKKRVTPAAMNTGIKNSAGELITIINSHAVLDSGFLSKSVSALKETGADAVGGRLNTINDGEKIFARSIPIAADSFFGAGGRRYRNREKPGLVSDTLPYCVYKKDVFNKIGMIDEELLRDQDEEFNYRLLKRGGKIFFSPEIKSHLHLRPSLKKLWRQHFQYGYFKVKVAQKIGAFLTWRQMIPALFVGNLFLWTALGLITPKMIYLSLFILAAYEASSAAFSFMLSSRHGMVYLGPFFVVFNTIHFSYGLGYLKGIIDFVLLKKDKKKKILDAPLTR